MRGFSCSLLLVATVSWGACAPKNAPGPKVLATGSVQDPTGNVDLEIAYQNKPDRQAELHFTLTALGSEEMDKLVLDVNLHQLYLVEGTAEWTGFVPPRQPQHHRLSLVLADDADVPRATVSVRRSRDSELLYQRELRFEVTPSGDLEPVP